MILRQCLSYLPGDGAKPGTEYYLPLIDPKPHTDYNTPMQVNIPPRVWCIFLQPASAAPNAWVLAEGSGEQAEGVGAALMTPVHKDLVDWRHQCFRWEILSRQQ